MSQPIPVASGAGRHLLLVDDVPEILESLSIYFQRHGYTVSTAETGAAGIQAYRNRIADVVLLDLGLPDMTGIQVLEALRKYDATVVMLTGQGDIATAVQAMQLGAENFLTKPPDLPHISAIVERAIEKADLRSENKRLQRYVPTTRKRVIRAVVSTVLLVAAAGLGLAVGDMGPKQVLGRDLAPTNQPIYHAPQVKMDTLPFVPGAPPPLPPARR
jgi:DNA-binding NtrC family response regulator